MFDPHSPARRLFGSLHTGDALVGKWAEQALKAQLGDFLATAWIYLRSYYVPSSLPTRLRPSTGLDPQLDFTYLPNPIFQAVGHQALEQYFGKFAVHRHTWGVRALRAWQVVFRFGATVLFVASLLILVGLATGSRRSRLAVLLFGLGGFSLLVTPVLTGTYSGRYTVPMAGPMLAAVAIAGTEVWRARGRRAAVRRP